MIDGWLKDFENQRKHFRSLFLHGEHVLMQVLLLLLLQLLHTIVHNNSPSFLVRASTPPPSLRLSARICAR